LGTPSEPMIAPANRLEKDEVTIRPRWLPIALAVFLAGCEPYNGPRLPPTKGGAEARNAVEYPLGLPATKAKRKKKQSATKKDSAAKTTSPAPVP
jgi:hypothetical protein